MPPTLPEIVIPKDKAVFWLDAHGNWHNEHGAFEHPKIIAHFNAHIRQDDDGYYLGQEINGRFEKVYFPYDDTALFAVDLHNGTPEMLILNTGKRIPLNPEELAMQGDNLYQLRDGERIKFNERCLLKLAERIDESKGQFYFISANGSHPIKALSSNGG